MASVMLATYPEVFAGGAIIAGLPYGCANNVKQAFELRDRRMAISATVYGQHPNIVGRGRKSQCGTAPVIQLSNLPMVKTSFDSGPMSTTFRDALRIKNRSGTTRAAYGATQMVRH